jgi:DNA-binding MltR family transcriptional regulator
MARKTLRDFTRELPSKEDQVRFDQAMNAESDLVCAIIQAIELDYIIEQGVIAQLVRRDDETVEMLARDNGPLATFFSKIVLGYAMGFYDDRTMEYLHTVRRIRNAFAHARKEISFASAVVRAELASLKLPRDEADDIHKGIDMARRLVAPDMTTEPELSGRASYVILCLAIKLQILEKQTSEVRERVARFQAASGPGAAVEPPDKIIDKSE